MTKILLDTNAYTAFMAGDQHVLSYMVDSEVVYISTIVIGELFAGFYGGDKVLQNKEELKIFLSKDSIKIIDVTMETAEIFGELKSALARKGRMIPLNDIWIAAHAIEYGSKLITYDEHFKNIDGVRIWEYLN
ncbi:PilT protein domain protein [uncultured spirochete]|jgi:tRNA(fMet)-specific endonuclease VapC|uniref:PilT protein domain protein n=1 Tax=uncultured spirochete TaxID=156406 RepID=A0A3P3XI70_9SPIR|nr:type II toxin-antitoxin system VapC family toxin [Rectinema subterraneum]SLM11938.1 PilT protein domain protein [uncultured spirochete]HBE46269.1 twitching motility protein PilT [Spirochaetaceae bacterium]